MSSPMTAQRSSPLALYSRTSCCCLHQRHHRAVQVHLQMQPKMLQMRAANQRMSGGEGVVPTLLLVQHMT